MNQKRLWTGIGASVGMLILILDGKTAMEGAQTGVDLCLKTVVPSLFPFFLLSILLTSSFSGTSLPLLRPLGRLCGIPKGAESILLSGFLGGYPVGAQSIAAAYKHGQLSKLDAERMLAFCNNAGPAFLFGMVASMFPRKWMAWALWGIHIVSAVLVSMILPANFSDPAKMSNTTEITLSKALHSSIAVMAAVCGWVVLFRVLISFLKRWLLWLLPIELQVAVTGLLELSNGCCELLCISDVSLRFLAASGILAFGGACVTMQTISVTSGLSLRNYLLGKVLQTVFSIVLSCILLYGTAIPAGLVFLMILLVKQKKQKKSSIPSAVGV